MKDKAIRKSNLFIFIKGFAIGIANIIPGVSGGTLALVLGVYERLIDSINHFSLNTAASVFKVFTFKRRHIETFKDEMKKVDMRFLLVLFSGVAVAFVAFSKLMTTLLETHHEVTYGFFFGLILASIAIPFSIIRQKNIITAVGITLGTALVILISVAVPDSERIRMAEEAAASQTAAGLDLGQALMIVVTGVLSISATILPGISGSFVSLLLGQYFYLLKAVSEANFAVLGLYAVGAIIGLKLLAKLLDYLLQKYNDGLMAFMTGLVVGSLYVTWPFKNTYISGGETMYLSNTLPKSFLLTEWLTLGMALLGIAIVVIFIVLNKIMVQKRERANTSKRQ